MANLTVETQNGLYHIRSQEFYLQFPKTDKNTRVLWLLLRGIRDPATGNPVFTHEQIAKAFGYKHRQNIQNFEQEFQKCGRDILAYLQRKCKVDASVVEAVAAVLVQHPLAPATELCPLVQDRLTRTDVTPDNIRTALDKVPCSVIRPVLQQQWEAGSFHPKEQVVLEQMLALLLETAPDSPETGTLMKLGVPPAEHEEEPTGQFQQKEAVPLLLTAHATIAQIPVKIRLMVVAFTLYYWNVPLSRIAVWMEVSPSTVLNWVTGLAVVLYPPIHAWMVDQVTAVSLAVDEKWLKITRTWHYWFVAVDEATGLPVAMALLTTRTTWACCWFLLTVKHLGLRPRAIITDGLKGYEGSIQTIFPSATHLLCLFHHQQGVTRWLREHAADLSKKVTATLKRSMKRVVQTCDPRTARRRLARLASEEGVLDGGLESWLSQTAQKLDRLEPALRNNSYPRTTNSIERFFRAFQRFYKTRGGFYSVMSARRELMLFVVAYVCTVQPGTGKAPIEQIVPEMTQMPFYHMMNAPFHSGLLYVCQAKYGVSENPATRLASLAPETP